MELQADRIAKASALAEPGPIRGIKLLNLETACCVARLGTLTAAARLLCTTQPAVSARIRELEHSLGMKLFRRQKFGVELTEEGREFLAEVEPLLLRLQQVSTSVRRGSSAANIIRLGNGSPCLDWLPLLVREFQARTPRVRFDIKTEHTNALLHKIELRTLDVGIAAGPIDASRFHSVSVGFDRMLWVTSANDPHLALDLNAYLSKVFVWCGPTDSFYWPTVMREVLQLGVAPGRLNHIASMLEAKAMVLIGSPFV